ncbi:unnamed protein product [Peronospora belbahrii]|uniref:Apple domain-containing protein n=1 Tax=Peronospora belbahrii TaxID=622444 RepID=A0AAU9KTU3_9STRA|nr:unnamed protein product [Peronospora belbahrii]
MAAGCAVSAQETNADFLIQKTFTDGTKRYTISAQSGQDANANDILTDLTCPGYKEIYSQFSSLLEMVVLSVATMLDATNFTIKDGYGQVVSSRKLMTDAVRLDHFHAYETPSQRRLMTAFSGTDTNSSADINFTFDLHEDNGMFIVFPTPAFYKVSDNGFNHKFESVLPSGINGLEVGFFIQTHDGQLVEPILKPDYVTLMVGTEFNQWMLSSHHLPTVTHAMRMLKIDMMPTQLLIRAWFGKMTLLPSYQHGLGKMDYEAHMNASAHYVQQGHELNHYNLRCAPGRRLTSTKVNPFCYVRSCRTLHPDNADDEGCNALCNTHHDIEQSRCYSWCSCGFDGIGNTEWHFCALIPRAKASTPQVAP